MRHFSQAMLDALLLVSIDGSSTILQQQTSCIPTAQKVEVGSRTHEKLHVLESTTTHGTHTRALTKSQGTQKEHTETQDTQIHTERCGCKTKRKKGREEKGGGGE